MKKTLIMAAVAILAMGCNFYREDGSLNMRVAYYDIAERHWIFDRGEGPHELNRHYYYTIDRQMDRDIDRYLNERTFDETILVVEREMEVWDYSQRDWVIARVPVPNTVVREELYGSEGIIDQHTEVLTYDYSADPAQINIHYFDSRFMSDNEYQPIGMRFRVVFMWP